MHRIHGATILCITSFVCLLPQLYSAPYASSGYGYQSPGSYGSYGSPYAVTKAPYNTSADITVLQYALTLEHLEAAFYVTALQNWSLINFLEANLTTRDYAVIAEVRDHEQTHVAALTATIAALGANPVPPCTYNFPTTNVASFLTLARALEKTGVSAYDGAVQDISNPAYLITAARIVTVEARHAAFFNYISGKTPAPQPFDIPLGQRQIISIASQFIVSCPYNLPMPYPALTIAPATSAAGVTLKLTTSVSWVGAGCAFLTGSGTNWLVPVINGTCVVPITLTGDVYVVLTSATSIGGLNDANTLAGPAEFVVPDAADVTP